MAPGWMITLSNGAAMMANSKPEARPDDEKVVTLKSAGPTPHIGTHLVTVEEHETLLRAQPAAAEGVRANVDVLTVERIPRQG